MSKGVPIAQRPDLKDASLSARLDAVFGSLGPAGGAGGWSLRQDIQFRAGGGIEEYNYSSDEEDPNEGLQPLMPSRLVDSDDEDDTGTKCDDVPPLERADLGADADDGGSGRRAEERAVRDRERLRASLSSRRAFEAEAEEDEFDRVATSTMDMRNHLVDAKPPGFTEVPLDSAWERMHNRWERQQQLEQQQPDQEQEQTEEGAQAPVGEAAVAPGAADVAMEEEGGDTAPAVAAAAAGAAITPTPVLAAAGGEGASTVAVPSRKRARGTQAAGGAAAGGGPGAAAAPESTTGGDVAAGDVEMMATVGEGGGADADAPGDAAAVSGGGFAGVTSESVGAQLAAAEARTAAGGTAAEVATAPRQRGGRRVQWADFVAASRPGDADQSHSRDRDSAAAPNGDGSGPKDEERGRGGAAAGRGRGGRVRLDWQRRGFVPDHVRNPHKYTMYTLDEELVVGGSDRSGTNGHNGRNGSHAAGGGASWRGREVQGEDEMRQALASARNAVVAAARAEHDPERAETTFGSGITFRSRAQRLAPPQAAAADPGSRTGNGTSEAGGQSLHHQGQEPRRQEAGNGAAGMRRGVFAGMEGGGGGGDEDDGGRGEGAGAEWAQGGGGGAGGGGGGGGLAEGDDAGNGGLRGGGRRHFRARRTSAEDEGEGKDGAGGPTGAMQED